MWTQQNFWRFGLRFCLYCGSFFPQAGGLCEACREDLWDWVRPKGLYSLDMEGFKVHSLFQWVPGWQETLSRLILCLKGQGAEELWREYAAEFWRRRALLEEEPMPPLVLIPSPSRDRQADHAEAFAQALAAQSGAEIYRCLRRDSKPGKAQRHKNRRQRARTSMGWDENFSEESFRALTKFKHIVFVDDIVTTGFTAKAAWRALGRPRDFAVWSLAQRSLPCGGEGDLL